MGLAAAGQLQRYGIPFVGFELHADVSGLRDIHNLHSTLYESTHLISSRGMTQFDEFPMADTVAPYPHHSHIGQYFRDYAEHFDLRRHYRFVTRVLRIERQPHGWRLLSECAGEQHEWHFDGILIANGTLHTPNQPALPGTFADELLHSSAYKNAQLFAGKRVLVVGRAG